VQAYAVSAAAGIVMILCIMRWLWETDRPIRKRNVDVGAGIILPTYAVGRDSHGWWAMNILYIVMGMMLFVLIFSSAYLRGVQPQGWIAPPPWSSLISIVALNALGAALATAAMKVLSRRRRAGRRIWILLATAPLALVAALYGDVEAWRSAGLSPAASGQGATTFALLAQQGTAVAFCLLMGIYAIARGGRNLIRGPRSGTADTISRFIIFAAAQGVVTAIMPRLVVLA
jgi:cytochrome c oxidase subunit I+III